MMIFFSHLYRFWHFGVFLSLSLWLFPKDSSLVVCHLPLSLQVVQLAFVCFGLMSLPIATT